ncbi:MAG: hypothetical protein Q4G62_07180 [Pseudomonadota bacterium]|nr:hypothetical protein [Pseudomonadota bacterium]
MKLEAGKSYRARNGAVHHITALYDTDFSTFPAIGSCGKEWTADGDYYVTDISEHDLIEEVTNEPGVVIEVGKTYRDREGREYAIRNIDPSDLRYPIKGRSMTRPYYVMLWTATGQFIEGSVTPHDLDLAKEVIDASKSVDKETDASTANTSASNAVGWETPPLYTLNIVDRTYVNGRAIDKLPLADLVDIIRQAESELRFLGAIQHPPKQLIAHLDQSRDNLDTLVEIADARSQAPSPPRAEEATDAPTSAEPSGDPSPSDFDFDYDYDPDLTVIFKYDDDLGAARAYVNDIDVQSLTIPTLVSVIEHAERHLKRLESLNHTPKRVIDRAARLRANLQALVDADNSAQSALSAR